MKKLIFIIIPLSLFFACKSDPLPRHAIPRQKFIDILVDVHIAEGMILEKGRLKIDSIESTSLYLSILEKHEVSKEQMLKTSLYYSRHQREYKKIYTDVLDKFIMMIEEENMRKNVEVKTDSIPPSKINEVKTIEK